MIRIKSQRIMSAVLAFFLLFSSFVLPVSAQQMQVISIKEEVVTPNSTSITAEISQLPSSGILRVVQLEQGEVYDSAKLNSYTSLYFSVVTGLAAGENQLELSSAPAAGKQMIAVLRDSSGDELVDYVSNAVNVTDGEQGGSEDTGGPGGVQDAETILAGCSVDLLKEGNFQMTDTSASVRVKLHSSIDKCYLTIFAYAGNTSFDADASQNIRLWSGFVADGYEAVCDFSQSALPLKKGYKVIACLNVPVGEDYYRSVTSRAVEVVDENGEGFTDYIYPDVSIDEQELQAGATSLHISLTGDPRIFQAAKEGKTSVTCAVAQYPAEDDFDFESQNQISLLGNYTVTEPFQNLEINFPNEPLRAGYRVRAVVYWTQNTDLFLPKGNDYEAMFQRPDDSVLISGVSEEDTLTVSVAAPVEALAEEILVSVSGKIPEGTTLLLKSYDSDADEYLMNGGSWAGSAFDLAQGTVIVSAQQAAMTAGNKLVAFLQNQGTVLAQSEPVTIQKAQPFAVSLKTALTSESTQAVFQVSDNNGQYSNINIASLCRVSGGAADTGNPVARLFGQSPGEIAFDIPAGSLSAGDEICLVLTYNNGDSTFESDSFFVSAPLGENSVMIREREFTTDSSSATVIVTGCEEFKGGRLILTAGSAANADDADSRSQIASVMFDGEGTYQFTFSNANLKAGDTILPHLYIYDFDHDVTKYKYGSPVNITAAGGTVKEALAEIATESVRADLTSVWVITDFDSSLTGTLKLYTYTGDAFDADTASEIYSGEAAAAENSQKITFGENRLTAGHRLIAVLDLSDGTSVQSEARVIQVVPEKEKPVVQILDGQITVGDTQMKAKMTFDSSVKQASYKVYLIPKDAEEITEEDVINSGSLYSSVLNRTIYLGSGKLSVGDKLQLVLTLDGEEFESETVTVEPAPDWGVPYAAFEVPSVMSDADSVSVRIDYDDGYLTLGDDFYCDVSIYQFSGNYTDEEFEEGELWENMSVATRIAQANFSGGRGDETRGTLNIPLFESAVLNPGDRLIIKLRLPHTEWEGEEVDYLSSSVPVLAEGEVIPEAKVILYNLGEEKSRGARVRAILQQLGIAAETMTEERLNETVGYLGGYAGYEAAGEPYEGEVSDTEFMLISGLSEAQLDRFLDAMTKDGLRIDHKAVVTDYNRDAAFYELIGEIQEEHDVFQALLALNDMIQDARKLDENTYGSADSWNAFESALAEAEAVLSGEEPSLEDLQSAERTLKQEYLILTGLKEITGSPVITIVREEDGTFTMNARVDGVSDGIDYQYQWSSGAEGACVKGISAQDLIGNILTVTSEGTYGELTAQLQVPETPDAAAEAGKTSVALKWNGQSEKDNCPAVEKYVISVYLQDELVKTLECDGNAAAATVSGLAANTEYTLKMYAVSPVGRSDMNILTVKTAAASSGSGGSGSNSGSGGSGSGSGAGSDENGPAVPPAVVPSEPTEKKYADVGQADWYNEAVQYVSSKGLMTGTSENLFSPQQAITRGMIAEIIYRMENSPEFSGHSFFDVTAGKYYASAVEWANSVGIVKGYGDGTFGPEDEITREQFAAILYRYAGYKGYSTSAAADLSSFTDAAHISGYAKEAVSWANAENIIRGRGNGILDPKGGAKRSEAAQMLMNYGLKYTA